MYLLFLCGNVHPLVAQTGYFSGVTASLLANGLRSPYGAALDSGGNVFVADTTDNQVKEILAAGGYTTVRVLGTGGNDFDGPQGVAVDKNGNVFVADTSNNAIKEILAAGGYVTVNTIVSGLSHPYGLAVDNADNIFIADTFSGPMNTGSMKEAIAPVYTTINTLGNGFAFSYPSGVAVDASGNVFVADKGNNAIEKISPLDGYTAVVTLLSGQAGPSGVAVDASENVFFTDTYDSSVKELLAAGDYATLLIFRGSLSGPTGVAVDGRGNLFVADQGNNAIKEIMTQSVNLGAANVATGTPLTVALSFTFLTGGTIKAPVVLTQGDTGQDFADAAAGDTCAAGNVNASATCTVNVSFSPNVSGARSGAVTLTSSSGAAIATAYLYGIGLGPQLTFSPARPTEVSGALAHPAGVAVDASSNVFVADTGNSKVKEFLAGGAYASILQIGSGFSSPGSVAIDGAGNVFVADTGNNSVKEIVAAGGYTTISTIGGVFSGPRGVAVDGFGNVFVADTGDNAVKEILASGGYATTIPLGSGFAHPTGVAVDANGNVFVADSGNNAVKEITAAGGYTTVTAIGTGGTGFAAPNSVALDGAANVFVADSSNNQIKEILATGGYATVIPLNGTFLNPLGVAVDQTGNVFVANSGSNEVAKLDFVDPPSLNFASTPVGATSSDSPQTVTLNNIGNVALTFPPPSSGFNPAISTGFTLNSGSTCPQVSSTSSAATLAAGSSCTDSISFTPAVQGTITGSLVTQDDNLNAAYPGYATQTIPLNGTASATSPTIVFNVPDHVYGDAPFTVSASSNSTGAFTYSVLSGPATIAGTTVTIAGAGAVVLRASEAADANYTAGFKDATFNVAAATPTIVFSVPNHVYGDPVFTVNATSNSTGALTYTVVSGPATIAGSTITLTGAGTVVLRASEAADANYAAGSKDATFTVAAATPTITFSVPNHTYGDPPFTVTATSNSTGAFTYSVVSGPASVAGSTVTITGAGTVVLRASEAADANYTAATKDATFTVSPATPTIVFSVPNHTASDAPFSVAATSNSTGAFTYTVVSGPATIAGSTVTLTGSGTVVLQASEAADANYTAGTKDATFTVAGATPAIVFNVPNHVYGDPPFTVTATSNSTGAFTYSVISGPATIAGATVTITGAGTVVLRASEGADANYLAGSKDATFNIAPATPAIVFSVPNHTAGDTPFTVSATSNSTGAFTYSVVSGPATITGSTVTLTGAGTVVLQASEAADANYAADSRDATFTVSGVMPAIVFTVPNHQYSDVPFVVSAISNSPGAFMYNVVSGPATISGATVTLTGAGQVVLQALQAASGSYSAGSADTTFTVAGSITLSVTPDTATVNPGAVGTFSLMVVPAGSSTFADPINFAAFGLPDGYSYVFSPATLPPGSAATAVTLTVKTTTAAANEHKLFPGTPFAPLPLALLMLPLFGIKSGRTLMRKMSTGPKAVLILFLSMGALLGLSGCGSGVFKTPHKYDIAIIATDSTTTATTTTEVSLIVQ